MPCQMTHHQLSYQAPSTIPIQETKRMMSFRTRLANSANGSYFTPFFCHCSTCLARGTYSHPPFMLLKGKHGAPERLPIGI
ncbi:unnamed protein product [Callosobruchus maculatus]|uniref:Uncharacterized protein n=1 Tax=Callosobruchus maculatus TaxID=64391 RepID=A0A653C7N5_CALMS|nr:unnamed protein product [Callosobruchus maculatus]